MTPVGGFVLDVGFADGERRRVDLAGLVRFRPAFWSLRDPEMFNSVRVDPELQSIAWPNGVDVNPDVLYGLERRRGVRQLEESGIIASMRR